MPTPLTRSELSDTLEIWELRLKLQLGAMMLAGLIVTALICRLM